MKFSAQILTAPCADPGPVFCFLLGVTSDSAQPITGQITEETCPVIGWAQAELAPRKRQKWALVVSLTVLITMKKTKAHRSTRAWQPWWSNQLMPASLYDNSQWVDQGINAEHMSWRLHHSLWDYGWSHELKGLPWWIDHDGDPSTWAAEITHAHSLLTIMVIARWS